jgi:hypothetical protein
VVLFEINNGAAIKETRLKRFPVSSDGLTDPETPPHLFGAPFGAFSMPSASESLVIKPRRS